MVALNRVYQSQVNYQTGIQVEHALIRSNPDRFFQVAASAFYGIVELSGWVASLDDKLTAIRIAERIPGVTTVIESMSIDEAKAWPSHAVRLRPSQRLEQKSMADRNTARLRWHND